MATLISLRSASPDALSGDATERLARDSENAYDRQLVSRAAQGDVVAQGEIYRRHAPGIAKMLDRLLGMPSDRDDLVQETFLRAFERMHSLENVAKMGSWIRSMAVYVGREWLKRRARRRWSPFREERFYALPPAAEVREAVRDAYAVLARMPSDESLVFSLRHIEGLEIEELALALDASPSTAKRRLRRADERFRLLAARYPSLAGYMEDP